MWILVPVSLFLIFFLLYLRSAASSMQAGLSWACRSRGRPACCVGGAGSAVLRVGGGGFIRALGVAVLNSLLLVTFIPSVARARLPLREAVRQAVLAPGAASADDGPVASLGFRAHGNLDRHGSGVAAAAGHRRHPAASSAARFSHSWCYQQRMCCSIVVGKSLPRSAANRSSAPTPFSGKNALACTRIVPVGPVISSTLTILFAQLSHFRDDCVTECE